MLIASVLGLLAVHGLRALASARPVKVAIDLNLKTTGDTVVSFNKNTQSATSPACGCKTSRGDRPPGGWQGITFPARSFQLTRSAEAHKLTQWDVFTPSPATWSTDLGDFGIDFSVSLFYVRDSISGPATIDAIRHRQGARLVAATTDTADSLTVLSARPVEAASLSSVPLGALGAPSTARTRIGYSPSARNDGHDGLELTTSFQAASFRKSGSDAQPMIDVLAPAVVVFDFGHGQPAFLEDYVEGSPRAHFEPGAASKSYTTHLNQLRTTIGGPSPEGWHAVLALGPNDDTAFAMRLVPRQASSDRAEQGSPNVRADELAGRLKVEVDDAFQKARALAPALRATQAAPLTQRRRLVSIMGTGRDPQGPGAPASLYTRDALQFEYPPTPPAAGVNVFGSVSDLTFTGATGSVTVGSHARSYGAPTALRLTDITGRGTPGQHMLIPVRISGANADVRMQGTSKASINGTPVKVDYPWWRSVLRAPLLNDIEDIFTPLAFLAATASLVRDRRHRRPGRRLAS